MELSRERIAMGEKFLEDAKSNGFKNIKISEDSISPEEFHKAVGVENLPFYPQGKPNAQYVPDNVNHPPHYNASKAACTCGRRIECIDVTRHLTFNIGNAIKYLWRCELKGNTLEDLKKAAWYIADEIQKREKAAQGSC